MGSTYLGRVSAVVLSPFVWAFAGRYLLPVWFLIHSIGMVVGFIHQPTEIGPISLGLDARIYYRAAEAWLAGGDPWAAAASGYTFAAPPPTLLPVAPFLAVGEDATVAIWIAAGLILAVWSLKRLDLPLWWLVFPPMLEAIWVANFNVAVLALLVAARPWADAVASMLKLYALVPVTLLNRWRGLLLTIVVLAVTAPLLPWFEYAAKASELSRVLLEQADGGRSAAAFPLLIPAVLVALAILGRERAAWLAVPALWPATQAHYVLLALPVLHPVLAAIVATKEPIAMTVGVIGWAFAEFIGRRRRGSTQDLGNDRLPAGAPS